MVTLRRSARQTVPAKRQTGSGSSDEGSDFENIEDSASEEEFEPNPQPKKKARQQPVQRRLAGQDGENALFKALSDPSAEISELALEWVSRYMENEEQVNFEALAELFNLILKAVGCNIQLQPHDLINPDAAPSTVADLAALFERQRYHEYPFISSNKEVKHFRKNVLEFFQEVIFYAHEKGCLYKTDSSDDDSSLASPFMLFLFSWLRALSVTQVRPLRLVSTVVLLHVQTQLCHQATSNMSVLEKLQKQLNSARNSKPKRNQLAHEAKIRTLTENTTLFQKQKDTIDEYLDDIVQGLFIHRYRDLDNAIRMECVRALGDWMLAYPGFFFLSAYLRYFGWLLSDPTNLVREEVVKVLHKLYKFASQGPENVSLGFRKFTKRFQLQLVNMVWKEKVVSVKMHLFGIYLELFKLGFLTDDDSQEICLYFFYLVDVSASSDKLSERLGVEAAKFVSALCTKESSKMHQKYSLLLTKFKPLLYDPEHRAIDVESFFKLRYLIAFLQGSFDRYADRRSKLAAQVSESTAVTLIERVFQNMYGLNDFSEQWETILEYALADISALRFRPNIGSPPEPSKGDATDFQIALELRSDRDVACALSLLQGAVENISLKKNGKRSETEAPHDLIQFIAMRIAHRLADLESLLSRSVELYAAFLSLVNNLLTSARSPSLMKIFENSDSIDHYNTLHGKILLYYVETDQMGKELTQHYKLYFTILLGDKTQIAAELNTQDQQLPDASNSNIYLKIEDLLLSLTTEVTEELNSTEPATNFVDEDEEQGSDLGDQKDLCNILLRISSPLAKISQVGDFINVNKFTGEPLPNANGSVLELITIKLLSKINIVSLIELWPNNLLRVADDYKTAWDDLLNFLLVSLCWKLEDLIYAHNDNTADTINVELFLGDFTEILQDLSRCFVALLRFYLSCSDQLDQSEATKKLVPRLESLVSSFGLKLADIITSLRAFYNQVALNNTFRGFNTFFNSPAGSFVKALLPSDLEEALLGVFLFKEARLGGLLGVELERGDNEDVNLREFEKVPEEEEQDTSVEAPVVTQFDSSDEEMEDEATQAREKAEEDARLEALQTRRKIKQDTRLWETERDISVCLVKLMSLVKSSAFSQATQDRIKLNGNKLGETFQTILQGLLSAGSNPEQPAQEATTAHAKAYNENAVSS